MSEICYRYLRQKLILLSKTKKSAAATDGAKKVLHILYIQFVDCCVLVFLCFSLHFVGDKGSVEEKDEERPGHAARA